jgi:hypothetical protein
MLPAIFIAIWVLTLTAELAYIARVVIRYRTKKLGYQHFSYLCRTDCYRWDDLFLGIGAVILLQTYIVGTILYGWVEQMYAALDEGNYVWLLENDVRIVRFWYSTSATYIFSIVSRFEFVSDVFLVVDQDGNCVVSVQTIEQYLAIRTMQTHSLWPHMLLLLLRRRYFLGCLSTKRLCHRNTRLESTKYPKQHESR